MLEYIFTIAFMTLFLHASTWDGMINAWIPKVTYNWPEWVKKPLYDCPICCAPWWGALILLLSHLTGSLPAFNWFQVVCILFGAGGVNTVLIYMISSDKELTKELKDE